eukprot:760702-Hanusia_phi.AAC.2
MAAVAGRAAGTQAATVRSRGRTAATPRPDRTVVGSDPGPPARVPRGAMAHRVTHTVSASRSQ